MATGVACRQQLDCADDTAAGGNEVISVATTQGTDYYVFVDGYYGDEGDFTLTVQY